MQLILPKAACLLLSTDFIGRKVLVEDVVNLTAPQPPRWPTNQPQTLCGRRPSKHFTFPFLAFGTVQCHAGCVGWGVPVSERHLVSTTAVSKSRWF